SVRWRLVAWSGGSTLLVLLALGIALYLSVASSLQATAFASLDQRASDIIAFNNGERPDGDDDPTAFIFGDSTFAIIIRADGSAVGPRGFPIPGGLPDTVAAAAAKAAGANGRDLRLSTITIHSPAGQTASVPVRQLTVSASSTAGPFSVQVVQ